MAISDSFTIVVPTRDDPIRCQHMLESMVQNTHPELSIRVVFLVNDTGSDATNRLEKTISAGQFASLQPRLLRATRNFPTVEENIRHTLGGSLDAVDEHFLIIGNSDQVDLDALRGAIGDLRDHQLDLLLVGVNNCETYEGKPVRKLYATPRHLNPKNRLVPGGCHGKNTFSAAMTDYGPVDYLAYIGCQIYTKRFFRDLCRVQSDLPEPLYSIPVGSLELSTRQDWDIGFHPGVVVTRIDHLQYGANSSQQPPDWWVFRSRTDRGLSRHILLAVISNSLHLSPSAFKTLANSHLVSIPRGCPQYFFSNFLFSFVQQACNGVRCAPKDATLRYCTSELCDIVKFGRRLGEIEIGLSADKQALISAWMQLFGVIGDYTHPAEITQLMSASAAVLTLLDERPGMERWISQLV